MEAIEAPRQPWSDDVEVQRARMEANKAAIDTYEKAFARAHGRCSRIAHQIIMAPANSIAEMLVKIRVAIWNEHIAPLDEIDDWYPRGAFEKDYSVYALCALRDDLRRLATTV